MHEAAGAGPSNLKPSSDRLKAFSSFPLWRVTMLTTTEIQQDTHSGAVNLNPRWLRVPSAVKYSGLSRSLLTPEARSSLSQAR